jgi:hypothetical protein
MNTGNRVRFFVCLFLAVGVLVGVGIWFHTPTRHEDSDIEKAEIKALNQAALSSWEAAAYEPNNPARLDNLEANAEAIIRGIPVVGNVSRSGPAGRATTRIVHVCDDPIVPAKSLQVEENSGTYRLFLARAEVVHHQQVALLQCLIRFHGLKVIYVEGMNDNGTESWKARIEILKEMLGHEPRLDALRSVGKIEWADRNQLANIRKHRLKAGAAAVLEALGEVETLPLEASTVPSQDISSRDRAIVKRLLGAAPCAVATLGGAHDLAAELKRQAPGAEYLRVEVKRYVQADGR